MDTRNEDWKKALIKHQLPWQVYLNTDGFNSEDALFFGIQMIPYKILVNERGKIVALNPSIDEIASLIR